MLNSVAGGLSQAAESNANNGHSTAEKPSGGLLGAVRNFLSGGSDASSTSFGTLFGGGQPAYPDIRPVSLTPVVPGHRAETFEAAASRPAIQNDYQYFSKDSDFDFADIGESAPPFAGEKHSNLNNPWNLMFS